MPRRNNSNRQAQPHENEEDIPGRKTLVKPEKKDLDTPIVEYLEYFNRIKTANKWSDIEAGEIFPALICPKDRILDGLGEWTTFTELEGLLRAREECSRDAHLTSLANITRCGQPKDLPSLKEYQNRITQLVTLLYPNFKKSDREQLIRDHFVVGMPSEVQRSLLSKGKTLDDVVSLSTALFAAREEVSVEVLGREEKRRRQKCFNCGKLGHIARFCRKGNANALQPGDSSQWKQFDCPRDQMIDSWPGEQ